MAARAGAKEWLRVLPGIVLCGGYAAGKEQIEVWRPSLATLRFGTDACADNRTLRPRVLRGEGRPRRLGWINGSRRRLKCGE